ncbi:MAG: hypothetical protein M1835_001496 [Candelina submexicana]|nr:MAG: hypothetical protein M1835_001496 [Candelina submexicana]
MNRLTVAIKNQPAATPSLPLPPELRIRILQYLLVSEYNIWDAASPRPQPRHPLPHISHGLHVAVLRVSRLMHAEAVEILYKRNIFCFCDFNKLDVWLDSRERGMMAPWYLQLHGHFSVLKPTRRGDITLVRLRKACPDLKSLTLVFKPDLQWLPLPNGPQVVDNQKRTSQITDKVIEVILSSGIRGLKELKLIGLEREVAKEMMRGLQPMLCEAKAIIDDDNVGVQGVGVKKLLWFAFCLLSGLYAGYVSPDDESRGMICR